MLIAICKARIFSHSKDLNHINGHMGGIPSTLKSEEDLIRSMDLGVQTFLGVSPIEYNET